jgi:tight adherence protein C
MEDVVTLAPLFAAAVAFAATVTLLRPGRLEMLREQCLALMGRHSRKGGAAEGRPVHGGASRAADEPRWITLLQPIAGVSGAVAGAVLAASLDSSTGATLTLAALGGVAGWMLPCSWLEARRARRRVEITAEFPVMLDLLQISLQGGMGLPAAWSAVAQGLGAASEALAQEMRRVEIEVGFGRGWTAALDETSTRTGVREFRSLGSLLQQSERFGSDLSSTMRVLSDSLRHEEMQSLEERAHQASIRMLFPLGALMLPATLMLVVAPMLILLFEQLGDVTID